MIWRDGDGIVFWYDSHNFRFVPMSYDIDRHIRELFPSHIHQSFILDYIEYLIETGIDKHLILEHRKRQAWHIKRDIAFQQAFQDRSARITGALIRGEEPPEPLHWADFIKTYKGE